MPIRKSSVSGGGIASGTTADRPATPSIGDQFYNGTLGVLEIYTTSGWLPATGANDFNIVLTGDVTSVTLDKEYFSGAYTITSALNDTSFDLYLFDTSNNSVGYTKTPSINATGNFNKAVIYGGTNGDLLSFAYKTTFTTQPSSSDTFAAPYVVSVDNADLANIDDSVTITGGNFDTDVQVWFDGQNDYSEQAKSIVYGSSTSIVAVRPDSLLQDNSPYTLRLVKPGRTEPSGSSKNRLVNGITAGGDPVWVTQSMDSHAYGVAFSQIISATDPDGGAITYSLVSGNLPSGLSLNTSTGEISGTPTDIADASFIISATDAGGNITNQSFSVTNLFGKNASYPAANGVELWDAGYRTSGLYYISTSNGGVKQVYVDLTTTDATTGKAGWMLVASINTASDWTNSKSTSSSVFGTTSLNQWSNSFGQMPINFFRLMVSSDVTQTGINATSADFYYYWSTQVPEYRQIFVPDANNYYTTSTIGESSNSIARMGMKQFTHAYNIKFAYQAPQQVWNNFSDPSSGKQGDWWNGLAGTATSIGYRGAGDGTFGILPSNPPASQTGSGQDTNYNQTKFGYDDDGLAAYYGTSATDSLGANNTGTKGSDTILWMWIK